MANGQMATFTVGANQTKTLQAYAYKSGMANSDIHSADYTFEHECGGQAPMAPAGYPLDNPGNLAMAPDLVGTYTYALDKAGNRTSVNGTNYTPNTINQYTSAGGSPVTNGNDHEIQTYGGFTYIYMRDQELIRISAPGLTYDLAYDALGRCVKRTANNSATTYVYDGEKPILEYNAGGGLLGFNLYGKGIDEIIERGAYGADNQWHWYFLNQDHEGSVTHLTDGTGAIIERYRYDAFGAPTIYAPNWTVRTASSYSNRFLFTGRQYDGAWIYEYRARVYHSGLGRFMSEDPKLFDAGDYNLFRYCHNDPIDLTDPMGLAGDAGGGAVIDTPSADRLRAYEHAKEMFRGGAIEIGLLNRAINQSSQAQSIFMLREAAIQKYGAYDSRGRWANESRWISNYEVPKSIINDPSYNWQWAKELGGGLVTHFSVNRDIAPAVTVALSNLQQARHLGDLHTFDGAFVSRNTRGSGHVSAHGYGLALDINADTMPRGSRALQPLQLRTSFMRAGFVDGGTWVLPWGVRDPMHFTVGF